MSTFGGGHLQVLETKLALITDLVPITDPVMEGEAPLVAYKSAPFKHSHGCEVPDFPIRVKGV